MCFFFLPGLFYLHVREKTWVSLWDYDSWFYIVKRGEGGKRLDYVRCFLKEIGLLFLKPVEPNQTQIAGTSPLGESWGIFFNLDVRRKSFHTPLISKSVNVCTAPHERGRWRLLSFFFFPQTLEVWRVTSNPGGFCDFFRGLWEYVLQTYVYSSHLIFLCELLDSIFPLACALY